METKEQRAVRILKAAAEVICEKGYSEDAFDAILDFVEDEQGPVPLSEMLSPFTMSVRQPESPGLVFVPVEGAHLVGR